MTGCKRSAHTSTHTAQRPSQEWRGAAESRAETHTHTAHPSQEWQGASGARARAHTQPNSPARSGGAQPKPEPKHTHPGRTPQPGEAGYRRSTHTSTHTPQHPGQEWRGAAETRAQTHTPTHHTPARSGGVQGGLGFSGLILRVLDAFRPRGATWSGQVVSSPPGPSRGPSKTHLLPGGGVPRFHRARRSVPPRLHRFATPRSVHQLAAGAAGAYPPSRPLNAWSPRAPAPPGPCYWLVASGTPLGWRGGCLG